MATKARKKKSSKPISTEAKYWLSEDGLLLLECWARDGYTYQDIANRIGITERALSYWRKTYPKIDNALAKGREVVDYMVENALLKSALGYKTKETKVTTVIQHGTVVETIKEETEKEQAPNVSAIQCWLYNRKSDKWKNMNSQRNIIDDIDEDTSIEIKVTRAGSKNNESEQSDSSTTIESEDTWTLSEEGEETEVNSSITISKLSPEEAAERRETKRKQKEEESALLTKVEDDPDDLDYWPDDWTEDDEEEW